LRISTIEIENLDDLIREQINRNINSFLQFLELEKIYLTKYQTKLLEVESFKESAPIRKELAQIIEYKL
jgi:hypothetical protein